MNTLCKRVLVADRVFPMNLQSIHKRFLAIACSIAAVPCAVIPVHAASPVSRYNAAQDFSIAANPNGVWSYGWTAAPGGAFRLYSTPDSLFVPGISAWWDSMAQPRRVQLYVAHNDTQTPGQIWGQTGRTPFSPDAELPRKNPGQNRCGPPVPY